jgi:hypothetical protein
MVGFSPLYVLGNLDFHHSSLYGWFWNLNGKPRFGYTPAAAML